MNAKERDMVGLKIATAINDFQTTPELRSFGHELLDLLGGEQLRERYQYYREYVCEANLKSCLLGAIHYWHDYTYCSKQVRAKLEQCGEDFREALEDYFLDESMTACEMWQLVLDVSYGDKPKMAIWYRDNLGSWEQFHQHLREYIDDPELFKFVTLQEKHDAYTES